MHARRVRVLRGAAAASITVLVAATAHSVSGGACPPWLAVAAVLLAMPVSVWLVGRRPSLWRTASVVLVGQALFHALFAIAGSADATATLAHAHHATLAPAAHAVHTLTPGMTAAHLIAAAVTVVALTRGESVLRTIAHGIRRAVDRLVDGPALLPDVPPAAATLSLPRRSPSSRLRPVRGPPLLPV